MKEIARQGGVAFQPDWSSLTIGTTRRQQKKHGTTMNHQTIPSNEVHASSSTSPYPLTSSNKNPTVHDDDDIDTSSFEDLSMNAALGIDASESPPQPTVLTL